MAGVGEVKASVSDIIGSQLQTNQYRVRVGVAAIEILCALCCLMSSVEAEPKPESCSFAAKGKNTKSG